MRPDLSRLLLGPAGLLIGALIYAQVRTLPEPGQSLAVGALFGLLGLAAALYGRARQERWIIVLGAVLALYGLLRATILR